MAGVVCADYGCIRWRGLSLGAACLPYANVFITVNTDALRAFKRQDKVLAELLA
jgi:hypothetical protein